MSTLAPEQPSTAKRSGRKTFLAFFAAIVAIFALTACHYVGSGTINSASGQGKATFTFDLNCSETGGTSSGVLTYTDSESGVLLHGVADPTSMSAACKVHKKSETVTGTYTPLKGGTGGHFAVTLKTGGTAQDVYGHFKIKLNAGIYGGYVNQGTVYDGNIIITGS